MARRLRWRARGSKFHRLSTFAALVALVTSGAVAVEATIAGSQPAFASSCTLSTFDALADAVYLASTSAVTVTLCESLTAPSGDNLILGGPQGPVPLTSVTLNLAGYDLSITQPPATFAAIAVPPGISLTIEDTDAAGNPLSTGTLTAVGGSDEAGIGGGNGAWADEPVPPAEYAVDAGSVTISGGTVIATGGSSAAGIGGADFGSGGDVTVSGGTVTATGGDGGGAGIGAGISGSAAGDVTVSGGTVIATGGSDSAGIGGSLESAGGDVTVSGGTVTATGGGDAAGIGGGTDGNAGTLQIDAGATVTATNGEGANAVGAGYDGSGGGFSNAGTLVVPTAATLSVPGGVTVPNSGTIEDSGTIDNGGTIEDSGTIEGVGTIVNPGAILAGTAADPGTVADSGSGPAGTELLVTEDNYTLDFDLEDLPGTTPSPLQVFAGTVSGSGQSLPGLPAGYAWYTAAPGGTEVDNTTALSGSSLGGDGPTTLELYAHVLEPSITGISPDSGPSTGGGTVTITGSSFSAGATVDFGAGNPATDVVVVSSTEITATVPGLSELCGIQFCTAAVTVTGPGGLSNGVSYTYDLYAEPTITSIDPDGGLPTGGGTVTITGSDFDYPAAQTTVEFGFPGPNPTTATDVVVVSSTEITATVPQSPGDATGPVGVAVTTPSGTTVQYVTFTYSYPTPTVTGISPDDGPVAGGGTVTITGTGFDAPAAQTTVNFGGNNPDYYSVVVVSSTELTVTVPEAPADEAGPVAVTVTTPGGTSVQNVTFTYSYPTPTVTDVSPDDGPVAGGGTATVTGTGFSTDVTVDFGTGNPATDVVVVSSTELTVTVPEAPADEAGPVAVTVTTPGGTSDSETFTYIVYPTPTVTGISPDDGPVAGGGTATVTGTGFDAPAAQTTVDFGTGNPATDVVVVSSTEITVTVPEAPADEAGPVAVTVTTPAPGGTSNTGTFTYYPTPTVTGVSPDDGPVAGGGTATVTGTGFSTDVTVDFGTGNPATDVVVVSSTEITVTVPEAPGDAAALVDVTVTTPGGTSGTDIFIDSFFYVQYPTTTTTAPVPTTTTAPTSTTTPTTTAPSTTAPTSTTTTAPTTMTAVPPVVVPSAPPATTTTTTTAPPAPLPPFPHARLTYPNAAIVSFGNETYVFAGGRAFSASSTELRAVEKVDGATVSLGPAADPPTAGPLRAGTLITTNRVDANPTIYVAGNDGELHGFSTLHQFFSDGYDIALVVTVPNLAGLKVGVSAGVAGQAVSALSTKADGAIVDASGTFYVFAGGRAFGIATPSELRGLEEADTAVVSRGTVTAADKTAGVAGGVVLSAPGQVYVAYQGSLYPFRSEAQLGLDGYAGTPTVPVPSAGALNVISRYSPS